MTKLFENSFRLVNISFVNEMMMICNTLNLDIRNIIKLAETKPYGFHPFSPGIGVGGHCIPVDPVFLNKLLFDKFGIKSKSIEVALEINNSVTSYAVEKVFDLVGRGVIHCRILVIGVTYKKNINDWRESPSVKLIEKLQSQLGYYVDFYDSYVSTIHLEKQEKYSIDKLSEKKLKEYDLVILAQNHSDLPLDLILSHSRKILDCTGELPLSNKVCRL
jgi:UDP-N-acetyl-D-glucosamine dehydrogenase